MLPETQRQAMLAGQSGAFERTGCERAGKAARLHARARCGLIVGIEEAKPDAGEAADPEVLATFVHWLAQTRTSRNCVRARGSE